MSKQRDKGTRWESAVVTYLRDNGFGQAERRALAGTEDLGDVTGIPGLVIECKNQQRHSWAEWVDEATAEAGNAGADVGAVWAHRRGHSSPAAGYVVLTGETFVRLLRHAGFGDELLRERGA